MKKEFHIADLIAKKIRGSISPTEQEQLEYWLEEDSGNKDIYINALNRKNQLEKLEIYQQFNQEKVWSAMENELFPTRKLWSEPRKVLRFAATILLPLIILGGLGYIFFFEPSTVSLAEMDNVISPGTDKAVLILSDGQAMQLDESTDVSVISDGEARIRNENKQLIYSGQEGETRVVKYNELRTPRGGNYRLELADGSSVWLNAGSSLRFPVNFTDTVRQVYLIGEGYFEVSHSNRAFIVNTGNMNVKVLGTSFNISAYKEDSQTVTTLVEGSVRVSTGSEETANSALLVPDQQAILVRSEDLLSTRAVDASHYISWTEGKIEFNNDPLEKVMRRLARWYDFEFEFENEKARNFHFTGRLDREENISSILNMLEMTTDVQFVYRKKKILIQ